MQIPIINGIYVRSDADFGSSYPRNMVPVYKLQGISKGYLRPAEGIIKTADTPGLDRGGINWRGTCFRMFGTKFCSANSDNTITILADLGGYPNERVSLDYSFDYLGIASFGALWLFSGKDFSFRRITDVDLGQVIDFIWIDGYFLCTDGNNLVVTDLSDPFSVNPLKYGSSEVNPDKIVALLKVHNSPYAVNRYTIQAFQNIGGTGFPFQSINGSTIMRGAIGTHACCVFDEVIAFVGSGLNEPCSVWLALDAQSTKIATREIDTILLSYSEDALTTILVEDRIWLDQKLLYIHLPDQTLVYDANMSKIMGEQIWYILTSGLSSKGQYRASGFVWCYNRWIVGDPTGNNIGYMNNYISDHYGEVNSWEFSTTILYNKTNGAEFHEMELVCLTGEIFGDTDPVISTSYSTDGRNWSMDRPRKVGKKGARSKRINWVQMGNMLNWRIQRFKGTSDAHITVAALEARIEPLND